jgi:hypothetical protein
MQPEGTVFDAGKMPRAEGEMRELARMADSLVQQLSDTRQHYEQLRSDLDGARERAPRHTPVTVPHQQQEESDEEAYERIRLFALNLALSGSSRDDVALELREKFDVGVRDSGDILDAVFPETSPATEPKRRFGRRRRGS